jgi:farnesyl-diphosphate farnesyltransferase
MRRRQRAAVIVENKNLSSSSIDRARRFFGLSKTWPLSASASFKTGSHEFFPLLKKVARSFYLTIRFLPTSLQEPVGLAYLLARASDTIADEGHFSPQEREIFLSALRARIEEPSSDIDFLTVENNFKKNSQALLNDKARVEAELLQEFPKLLQYLEDPQRDSAEAHAIRVVWRTILEGQLMDVKLHGATCSAQERNRYLYLVAGCVGEFWTEMGAHHFKNYSKEPLEQMMVWGSSYGKGLQLLNILRDAAIDQRGGRFYFEFSKRDELVSQIQSYLEEGRLYVRSLNNRRLRYASALPLLLAEETLALMIKKPKAPHLKIGRGKVLLTVLRGWWLFWLF